MEVVKLNLNGNEIPVLIIDEEYFTQNDGYIYFVQLCYAQNRLFKRTFERDCYVPLYGIDEDGEYGVVDSCTEDSNEKITILLEYIQRDEWDSAMSEMSVD